MFGLFQELPYVGGELDEEAWSGSRLWRMAGSRPHATREERRSVITVIFTRLMHMVKLMCFLFLLKIPISYILVWWASLVVGFVPKPSELPTFIFSKACYFLRDLMIIMLKHQYSVTETFRCGPAAVTAVYHQKVEAQYDVPFVYAAVNANVHTVIIRDGKVLSTSIDKNKVGALICTKHPGSMRMQDITSEYKTEMGKRQKNTKYLPLNYWE